MVALKTVNISLNVDQPTFKLFNVTPSQLRLLCIVYIMSTAYEISLKI